jgi:hypothetical protein
LLFRCLTPHTSGTFATDLANWACVTEGCQVVTQATHGLNVLDVIRIDAGSWHTAKADSGDTLSDPPTIVAIKDTNYFVAVAGTLVDVATHGLTVDNGYYLSAGTAGQLTLTEPGTNYYSNPILIPASATTLSVLAYRPSRVVAITKERRTVSIRVVDPTVALTTGDNQQVTTISSELTGKLLVKADAAVYTVSSSGNPTIQVHNLTDGVDMLSTLITIDATEVSSFSAVAASVIDTAHDDVVAGDQLRIDVDVAGTGTKGLDVFLVFEDP